MKKQFKIFLLAHKEKFQSIIEITKSFADFALTKSKFSLLAGGLRGVEEFMEMGSNNPENLFSPANGWVTLSNHPPVSHIFISTLSRLEGKKLKFSYDNVKMYKTPVGEFVVIFYGQHDSTMLAQAENAEAIMNFLSEEKLKEMDSRVLSLDEVTVENQPPHLILTKYKLNPVPSPRATETIEEISSFIDKGINRSIMLYGLPGTGKTTLAHTIIDHFGFKTLKIHPSESIKLPYFAELIKFLKIEALILDDFDQVEMNDKLLEFLETVNKDLKLTIGIANVLEEFDPAVLRPGRFDEIKKIEQAEESVIRDLLGDLQKSYFNKVQNWPIAYIKELVKQNSVNPKVVASKFQELNDRVEKLIESYTTDDDDDDDDDDDEES